MDDLKTDIEQTKAVIADKKFSNYDRIYFKSNEDLEQLFSNINIKDKNVLTVLGSGDQVFYCYENDAKKVDMFDISWIRNLKFIKIIYVAY